MFTEKQLHRYAEVLLWGLKTARSGKEKKNDVILIRYSRPATRLAEILQQKILESGKHPVLRSGMTPVMEKQFYQLSNASQLVFQTPGEKDLYRHIHGSIFLHAPESITHLSGVDPTRIGKAQVARKYLKDILDKREASGDFGWTLGVFPTEALAHHAGLPLEDYARQVARACFIDRKDPVSLWEEVFKQATYLKKQLNTLKVDKFHIESQNIDLEITPGDRRRWIGVSGHNIPSFELFMSPDWRGTRGVYYADQPSYRSGNYVKGIRLEFKNGTVVSARAEEGEAFLQKLLAMDKGASRLGEFSLTDKHFSKINRFMANTLFDENFGGKYGNCHVALGSSYADTYAGSPASLTPQRKEKLGFNDSALHWDIVNTEKKRVTAHLASGIKMVIYENGTFI